MLAADAAVFFTPSALTTPSWNSRTPSRRTCIPCTSAFCSSVSGDGGSSCCVRVRISRCVVSSPSSLARSCLREYFVGSARMAPICFVTAAESSTTVCTPAMYEL